VCADRFVNELGAAPAPVRARLDSNQRRAGAGMCCSTTSSIVPARRLRLATHCSCLPHLLFVQFAGPFCNDHRYHAVADRIGESARFEREAIDARISARPQPALSDASARSRCARGIYACSVFSIAPEYHPEFVCTAFLRPATRKVGRELPFHGAAFCPFRYAFLRQDCPAPLRAFALVAGTRVGRGHRRTKVLGEASLIPIHPLSGPTRRRAPRPVVRIAAQTVMVLGGSMLLALALAGRTALGARFDITPRQAMTLEFAHHVNRDSTGCNEAAVQWSTVLP